MTHLGNVKMKNDEKKLVVSLSTVILTFCVFLILPQYSVRFILRALIRTRPFNPRILVWLWQSNPEEMGLLALDVLLVLLIFVHAARALMCIVRMVRRQIGVLIPEAARPDAEEAAPKVKVSSARTASPQAKTAAMKRAAGMRAKRTETRSARESARAFTGGDTVSYVYKTGKERYKEQFDGFLRDGVVTKEEYRELCRKLDQMDDWS